MITQTPLQTVELPITILNEIPLVQLPTYLSTSEAIALKATCQQMWEKQPVQIILDLSQTTSIDSSGIAALVSCLKTSEERGIKLFMWSVHPQVITALLLVGLKPSQIIDSETEAITLAGATQLKYQLPTSHRSLHSLVKRLTNTISALIGLGITALWRTSKNY